MAIVKAIDEFSMSFPPTHCVSLLENVRIGFDRLGASCIVSSVTNRMFSQTLLDDSSSVRPQALRTTVVEARHLMVRLSLPEVARKGRIC